MKTKTPKNKKTTASRTDKAVGSGPLVRARAGDGWRLLDEGEPLQPGDGFLHPDLPDMWTDYDCRPDIFLGAGTEGSWYYVPKNDTAHSWPWRRKVGPNVKGEPRAEDRS